MDGDSALALVESKLDQVQAAMDELKEALNRAEKVSLSEEHQDRMLLMMIKFGRHVAQWQQ